MDNPIKFIETRFLVGDVVYFVESSLIWRGVVKAIYIDRDSAYLHLDTGNTTKKVWYDECSNTPEGAVNLLLKKPIAGLRKP
jgi:hypothetical protein